MPPAKSSSPNRSGEAGGPTGAASAAPGRPAEVELASNRWLVHPLSNRLAAALAKSPVTPNQVSIAGLAAAAGGAACIVWLDGAARAGVVFVWLLGWHVLDGADGALARRTGRASPIGELIDGVCDHAAQGLIYTALALALARGMGPAAWLLAAGSAACHFVQANAYESWRKSYRHLAHGAAWMNQSFRASDRPSTVVSARLLAKAYLAMSEVFLPQESAIAAAIEAGSATARDRYRAAYAPLIRLSAPLSSNSRTLAVTAALLIGSPIWYFGFEIVALTFVLVLAVQVRRRTDRAFLAAELSRAVCR